MDGFSLDGVVRKMDKLPNTMTQTQLQILGGVQTTIITTSELDKAIRYNFFWGFIQDRPESIQTFSEQRLNVETTY